MTEFELNEYQSEFDPEAFSQSLQEDPSPKNRVQNFALLKTSSFLTFSSGPDRVAVLNSKDKEALIPAFTCREELEKWPFARGPIAEMSFAAMQRMVEHNARLDGIVVNPFGKALFFRRSHLSDMDGALRAATPRRDLKMKATRDYPIGLPMAVKELMAQHPEVYRVWLLAARSEGDTADRKLFVVDLDGKPDALFPRLAQAVRLYLREGEGIEMVKADIKLLRAAEQTARPIYEKK